MRFQRFIQPVLVCAVAVTSLTACGRAPRTFDQLDVKPAAVELSARPLPSPIIAADRAIELGEWLTARRDAAIFSYARTVVASQSPQPVPAATVLASSFDWACVAEHETGADYTMHGSAYSSAYGVLNEAVRENAPPDVAERILSGTASPGEQLAMAESVEVKHGVGAWASSTVAACAR